MTNDIVKKLNKAQSRAVKHDQGPALVVAGAGTGKTTILVERLNELAKRKKAKFNEILLLTFTEKGAGEMENRALEKLPYGCFDTWISTFHGFCERILRQYGMDIGLNPDFKILSQTEQWVLIKKNLPKFKLDYYSPLGNPDKFIYELLKYFSRLKDECISPDKYSSYAESARENRDMMLSCLSKKVLKQKKGKNDSKLLEVERNIELANAYHTYNRLLQIEAKIDFGDLIFYALKLFSDRPAILAQFRKQFKYIMVDEFQDTNWAQYLLVKKLGGDKNNIMVVGDDDQSIYKFRGASISNILQFKDDFPRAEEIVLSKNYRSGQKILDCAYGFIQNNNPDRLESKLKIIKKLESNTKQRGTVEHVSFASEHDEKEYLLEKIKEIYAKDEKCSWSDFALLTRSNKSAEDYSQELQRAGIPNTFVSLRGLYFKPIIIDIIAYFRLLDSYHEPSALYRVVNMEVFKIDHADIVAITRRGRKNSWSMFESLKNIQTLAELSLASKKNIEFLLKLISRHSKLVQNEIPSKVYAHFIHDAGLDKKEYHENYEYFSHLNQFYQKIKDFELGFPDARLKDFMEMIDLEIKAGDTGALRQNYSDSDTLKVMTVHSAKGLEFNYVFLPELVDKKFPTINRQDKISIPEEIVPEQLPKGKEVHLQEERRLFYVALTRAKYGLYLSSAKDYGGLREKKPSIFIMEAAILTKDCSGKGKKISPLHKEIEVVKFGKKMATPKIILPSKFSFSQIEAYSNCPLQYKYNFILKIPIEAKSVFVFGRVIHNALREAMSFLISGGQQELFIDKKKERKKELSLKIFLSAYERYWQNYGYQNKEEREKYKKLGLDMLKNYHKYLEEYGFPNVLYVEKSFITKLRNNFLRGSIDRVDRLADGSLKLVDYKTGNPKEKLNYKDKRQLLLYQLAIEDGLEEKVSELSFFYLKNAQEFSFVAKNKELDKFKEELIEVIKKIKTREFTAQPSWLCQYCDFNNICEFRQKNSV